MPLFKRTPHQPLEARLEALEHALRPGLHPLLDTAAAGIHHPPLVVALGSKLLVARQQTPALGQPFASAAHDARGAGHQARGKASKQAAGSASGANGESLGRVHQALVGLVEKVLHARADVLGQVCGLADDRQAAQQAAGNLHQVLLQVLGDFGRHARAERAHRLHGVLENKAAHLDDELVDLHHLFGQAQRPVRLVRKHIFLLGPAGRKGRGHKGEPQLERVHDERLEVNLEALRGGEELSVELQAAAAQRTSPSLGLGSASNGDRDWGR